MSSPPQNTPPTAPPTQQPERSPLHEDPAIARYVWRMWRDEGHAWRSAFRREWRVILVVLLVLGIGVLALDPFAPTTIRMAKGTRNSGLEVISQRYQAVLAKHGVKLELIDSDGAPHSMRMVSEGKVEVGLSQGGLKPLPNVSYMGSVAQQPLWLFYTGRAARGEDLHTFLLGKRVSIGQPGTGSHRMTQDLLNQLPEDYRVRIKGLDMSPADTISGLLSGKIDAAFLSATFDSRNTQTLLSDPNVQVFDFAATQGFARHVNYAESVTFPAGAVRYSPPNPATDVRMIATTVTLLTHPNLHPATQHLLMLAGREMGADVDLALLPHKHFPAFVDRELPRNAIAQRHIRSGAPAMFDKLPYAIAAFVDGFWIAFVALLAIIYPLMRIVPSFRRLSFDSLVSRRFRQIRAIRERRSDTSSRAELQLDLQEVRQMARESRELWVPNGCSSGHAALLSTLMQLEQSLMAQQAHIGDPPHPRI